MKMASGLFFSLQVYDMDVYSGNTTTLNILLTTWIKVGVTYHAKWATLSFLHLLITT